MRVLALVLLLDGPPAIQAEPEVVDVDAARDGIVVRAGERADDWTIEVGPQSESRVVVTLTAPDGWVMRREVTLDGDDPEARARQLAASAVVVIENYEPRRDEPVEPPPPEPEPEPEPPKGPAGWLSLGGRISTGPAGRADVAPGATLSGGTWVLKDLIAPFAAVGWRRSSSEDLTVDGVAIRAGVLVGTSLAQGHLWVGGGVAGGALGGFARDSRSASGWAGHLLVPAVAQLRAGAFFAQLDVGPELTLPPLRFVGNAGSIRWGHLRAAIGLKVGFVLGRHGRFGFRGPGSV